MRKRLGLLIIFALYAIFSSSHQAIAQMDSADPRAAAGSALQTVAGQGMVDVDIQGFHLVAADIGWLLLGQQLYWTRNGGATWVSITPPLASTFVIKSVSFSDVQNGWVVTTDQSNPSRYALARTANSGATWESRTFSLFAPQDENANAASVLSFPIDAQSGYLVVRRATSINFDVGTLFKTADGGNTWTRLAIPLGDPIYFATPDIGWTAGGVGGDELYRTADGGRTWTSQQVVARSTAPNSRQLYMLPKFDSPSDGVLPVIVQDGTTREVRLFATHDAGQSFVLDSILPLDREIEPGVRLPISVISTRQAVMIASPGGKVFKSSNRAVSVSTSPDPLTKSIVELDMFSATVGWGKHVSGGCTRPRGASGCRVASQLVQTVDGGQTWRVLALPSAAPVTPQGAITPQPTTAPQTRAPKAPRIQASHTQTFAGQGFDKCEIAGLSSLKDWWDIGPYDAVNLYIGGSSRGCRNTALSADYVSQISKQGWTFIPTWVGPQASCTNYASRMSSDANVAYNQGVSEANAAIQVAVNLGLSDSSVSGMVIYYDLESYNTTDTACRAAANSFISGWSGQLQARGNIAGAYGAASGSAVSNWLTIAHVPDALWLAHWLLPAQYRSDATVWDPTYVPDTAWADHQRIRQYSGGHNETWGTTTLNIDSDVIDGIVAFAPPRDSVSITSIWTADGNGTPRINFDEGGSIRYGAVITNSASIPQTITLSLYATSVCGPLSAWSGNWTAGLGSTNWSFNQIIPNLVCGGPYSYRLSITLNGLTTTQTFPFSVNGTTIHSFVPLITK